MKFRLLPSCFHRDHPESPSPPAQPLTTFIVTGAEGAGPLAIDAGSIGLVGDAPDMERIREVVLTHSHIDHVATLPMWIEACISQGRVPVRVHAPQETVDALRAHLFNDVLFPDFEALKDAEGRALMEWGLAPTDRSFVLAGLTLEAVKVNHPVPTCGYLVADGETSVLFASDSGPSPELWAFVAAHPEIAAIVLECSFPDYLADIAKSSGHLTPGLLRDELKNAPEGVKVFVTHLKPSYREGVARAVEALRDPRITVLDPGVEVEL